MDYFFKKKTVVKPVKSAKEAFLGIDEKLDKLMQPNEKIHLYKEDDLVGYLSECFDLMIVIEKEMSEMVGLSVDYPNFKDKWVEFGSLCDSIRELVDIAIDNLTHFSSFKHLSSLKEERERADSMLRSFSLVEHLDDLLEVRAEVAGNSSVVGDNDVKLDKEDFENAQKSGFFKGLSIDEQKSEEDKESKTEQRKTEDEKEEQEEILQRDRKSNVNDLVVKRMEQLMAKAKNRKPLSGIKHEKRVKDIREGKFKICVPAVTLVFKYLVTMFEVIKSTMEESIKEKKKNSFKKFMIYASKFSLIKEVLFSAFYANDKDLQYKELTDPEWELFFEVYDYCEPENLQKFNKQYKTLWEFLGKKKIKHLID